MNSRFDSVFDNIPIDEILSIAHSVQRELIKDGSLIKVKEGTELVTEADLKIQECLVNYFSSSSLKNQYFLKAEEEFFDADKKQEKLDKEFQLIIDPIDGTTPFSQGKDNWGVMVGICDRRGTIIYSWNLLATGEIYSSSQKCLNKPPKSFKDRVSTSSVLRIDIDDYGAGAAKKFPDAFLTNTSLRIQSTQIQLTSHLAAVYAGWELFRGNLDGLLWLGSTQGKRNYPDYDLVFLGALEAQGWKILLGKDSNGVQLLAIAGAQDEVVELWNTGLTLLSREIRELLKQEVGLKITSEL